MFLEVYLLNGTYSEERVEWPRITIKRHVVPLDPSVDVFNIELEFENGTSWKESPRTTAEVHMFLQGMRAMAPANMIPLVSIPHENEAEPLPDDPD